MKVNPKTDSQRPNDYCGPGRKLSAAVGFRRWVAGTGTPMITMGFVVLRDGAKNGDEGKVFMERFPVTPAAIWRMARWALATGYDAEFDCESDDDLQRIMAHGPVVVSLKETTYKGKKRVEVDADGWATYTGDHDPGWDAVISDGEEQFDAIQQRMEQKASSGGGYGSGSGSYSNSGGTHQDGPPASAYDDMPF